MAIKYYQSMADRPTFRTEKFGNLLSDTYQGEVCQSSDGTWNGWLLNYSRNGESEFKLGLRSKKSATRWVNSELKKLGIEQ